MPPILTRKEADLILASNGKIELSLDLGKTNSLVEVNQDKNEVIIENNTISLDEIKRIKEERCYFIENNTLLQVTLFSDETNFYYKLFPTSDWPTITLSSTPMHRHTKISPKRDTQLKIKEISPVRGNVLDTCCGLGYTSIMASRNATTVYVFERDPNILEVAKYNPYSEILFKKENIHLTIGSVFEGIKKFNNSFFDRIIHDPPTPKYSPELYSLEFYKELYRVLANDGVMYHYAPAPHKLKGEKFYLKIIKNLKLAGFRKAIYNEESSGIQVHK